MSEPLQLTSRERLLAAIRREPVDYVPFYGSFNPLSAVQRRGRTWNFPWPEDAGYAERTRYIVRELGLDATVAIGVPVYTPAPGVTSRVWLEGDVLHKAFSTPAGELHAAVRLSDYWPHGQDIPFYSDFNIGHFVEPWLQDEHDLACLKHLQVLREAGELTAEARETTAALFALAADLGAATAGGSTTGGGLTGLQQLCGATELCLLCADRPELVDDCLEFDHLRNLREIEVLGSLGVDIVRRNGFYETTDFYSPAMLDRFLTRRLNAEARAARAAGMVTAYTVHTGIMPMLDYLAGLEFDSLTGIDIAFKDTDIRLVRDRLAGTKAFWTGPSSTFHLWKGPEPTRAAVREVFDCFGRTGLILTQCVSSHSIMPWESTAAMIDEWRRLR